MCCVNIFMGITSSWGIKSYLKPGYLLIKAEMFMAHSEICAASGKNNTSQRNQMNLGNF